MRRYGLLALILLVSACAPQVATTPPATRPAEQPKAAPPQPAPAPAPVQPPPVQTPPVQPPPPAKTQPAPSTATPPPTVGPAISFEAWREQFVNKAVQRGFDRGFVEQELSDVQLNPSILNHDTGQPEFVKPISEYIRSATSPQREAEGRSLRLEYSWMNTLEPKYGVPPEILIAIWAQESGFGKIQGNYDVISAFATLAYDGRRRDWAEDQLIDALTIIRDKGIPRTRLKGSWAGAMGQTQFIPGAYLEYGQDADGNGKIDIWNDPADALATAANHLAKQGWQKGQDWAVEVIVPAGFDYSVSESEKHPPAWWAARGVKRADGRPWPAADQAADAELLVPAGARGPAFLAFPNHFVIRKYNNSIAYALSIGLMADAIRGEPPLRTPWPHEVPLSRADRFAAQVALDRLGYPVGLPDGQIGAKTREALRAWQKKNGLVADGYLTPEVVARLRTAQS